MASLTPRKPYTDEELAQLYPGDLELQLVQIVRALFKPLRLRNLQFVF